MTSRPRLRRRTTGGRVVRAGAGVLGLLRRLAYSPEVRRWHADRGATTLRFAYDLCRDSVVLDVGGYEGQWASDVYGRVRSTIHVFEPVPAFAVEIAERFAANPDVHVHAYGLAGADRIERTSLEGDRSRPAPGAVGGPEIALRRATDVLGDLGIEEVDLVKLNIEGGEFELLEHLLDTGAIERIRYLQVQFHEDVADARARASEIRRRLAGTHESMWCYDFLWESWRRRVAT